MALYFDRSRAQEEGTALIPDMPGYSDFKDKPFAKMVTEQDQIWWLYWHFSKLFSDTELNGFGDRLDALEDRMDKLEDALEGIVDDIAEIRRMIAALATSAVTYDVTKGAYCATIATSRRAWQAHHFDGMTVEDLAGYTVADAQQMEIRHIAVDGRSFYMHEDEDNEVIDQRGYEMGFFNPDEYVRKTDLTVIDTDNLADKSIMGVLKKDAATDYPDFIPYMRPLTAHDLANAMVRFDDNVIVPDEE